jgi:hypothetical protein
MINASPDQVERFDSFNPLDRWELFNCAMMSNEEVREGSPLPKEVRDSACMHVRANSPQHLYCGCTVSAGGFANISISSARVRWTDVNDNRS